MHATKQLIDRYFKGASMCILSIGYREVLLQKIEKENCFENKGAASYPNTSCIKVKQEPTNGIKQ